MTSLLCHCYVPCYVRVNDGIDVDLIRLLLIIMFREISAKSGIFSKKYAAKFYIFPRAKYVVPYILAVVITSCCGIRTVLYLHCSMHFSLFVRKTRDRLHDMKPKTISRAAQVVHCLLSFTSSSIVYAWPLQAEKRREPQGYILTTDGCNFNTLPYSIPFRNTLLKWLKWINNNEMHPPNWLA